MVDEIDYDELIDALRRIAEVFQDEIGPFAFDLCSKLGEAFLRLHEQRQQEAGSDLLDVDEETSLTAEGLMAAIRRILESISVKHPEMYLNLEQTLEQPILVSLKDPSQESTDDGLTCLCELVYN